MEIWRLSVHIWLLVAHLICILSPKQALCRNTENSQSSTIPMEFGKLSKLVGANTASLYSVVDNEMLMSNSLEMLLVARRSLPRVTRSPLEQSSFKIPMPRLLWASEAPSRSRGPLGRIIEASIVAASSQAPILRRNASPRRMLDVTS